ncbi:hypothetical protein SMA60_28275, partial [Escherichia coli]|uniref:hypothetical protein n=1 Tax=Escherichia coli TaxID=562 RepID=UPI00307AE1F3
GIVGAFWLFIDRFVSQKIKHDSHLGGTILPSDCQHKADGYLTALSETPTYPVYFLTKMLFPCHDADSPLRLI